MRKPTKVRLVRFLVWLYSGVCVREDCENLAQAYLDATDETISEAFKNMANWEAHWKVMEKTDPDALFRPPVSRRKGR